MLEISWYDTANSHGYTCLPNFRLLCLDMLEMRDVMLESNRMCCSARRARLNNEKSDRECQMLEWRIDRDQASQAIQALDTSSTTVLARESDVRCSRTRISGHATSERLADDHPISPTKLPITSGDRYTFCKTMQIFPSTSERMRAVPPPANIRYRPLQSTSGVSSSRVR
jgi:hypothetical protein